MKSKYLPVIRFTVILLFAATCGLLSVCSSPEPKSHAPQMLIVYMTGDVQLMRGERSLTPKLGMLVDIGDVVKTGRGEIDLQTRSGHSLRVKNNAVLVVSRLADANQRENSFTLLKGSLFSKAHVQSADEIFRIATPTSVAGVRGTAFSVSVDDNGRRPKVRVLNGKVAMSPRVAALDKISPDRIKNESALRQLAAVQNKEIVLEEKTQGALNPAVDEQLARADQGNLSAAANTLSSANIADKKNIKPTDAEVLDEATLLAVEPAVFDRVVNNEKAGQSDPALDELAKKREQIRRDMLSKLGRTDGTERLPMPEIKGGYSKTVLITLNDGSALSGVVLKRNQNDLLLRTVQGVITVKKSDIKSIQ